MQFINIDTWKRKEHFNFFYRFDCPQYNICANLDVTRFLSFVKKHEQSFYYSMIYAVTKTANQIENFKYRIREGKVVLHDKLHPSFTDLSSSDDLFKMITVSMEDDFFRFVHTAKEVATKQEAYFPLEQFVGRDDFVYLTCIPWISFTHMSHAVSINRDDAVPRISWGKYFTDGEKVLLPFSVQVHHALVDGAHVGRYYHQLQELLDEMH